jgi:hypothetical protein
MTTTPESGKPKLVEHFDDPLMGPFETRWYCDPPPPEISFRVVRDWWNRSNSIREIYEVELD